MNRIEQLKALYNEDPEDPLLMYMLALEYKNYDPIQAQNLFMKLIADHPAYLPAYYTTAELLLSNHEKEQALKIVNAGISLARTHGNLKALSELNNLKDEIAAD